MPKEASRERSGAAALPPAARAQGGELVPSLLAFLIGVLWFISRGGGPVLNPWRTDWLIQLNDIGWQYLAWLYYIKEPWQMPLGLMKAYPDPIGSSLAFCDLIPLLAVIGKLLRNFVSQPFQYFGPWLGLCFGMQALWGYRLVRLFSPSRLLALLGATLFAMTPPLLFRVGHAGLCAHFTLLGGLWLNLHPGPGSVRELRWQLMIATGLLFFAAAAHPYILVMVLGLLAAWIVRLVFIDRLLSFRQVLILGAAWGVLLFLCFYLYGFLLPSELGGMDNRPAGADLLTFFNGQGYFSLLPGFMPPESRQEGFAYLGIGILGLLVFAGLWGLRSGTLSRVASVKHLPLLSVTTLFMLWGFTTRLTLAGHTLLDLGQTANLWPLGMFRGAGRFCWLMHYLLITGSIAFTVRFWKGKQHLAALLLLTSLSLQAYEQKMFGIDISGPPKPRNLAAAPGFADARGSYQKLVLYPPEIGECGGELCSFERILAFGHLAHSLNMTTNSGWFARHSRAAELRYRQELDSAIGSGHFEPGALYIVHPAKLSLFKEACCGVIAGVNVCVAPANSDRLRTRLCGN